MRWTYLAPLALLWILGTQKAIAHGVDIKYQLTQALEIKAAYDTGEPMADAQVVVFAPGKTSTPWLTGNTDKRGFFTFTPDSAQPGSWEVQVRQAGHGEVIVIPVKGKEIASSSAASRSTESPKIAAIATNNTRTTPLQTSLMIGSVVWGCIGTALFFSRRKK